MPPMIYDWSNERIAKEADNHVMFKSGSSIRELAIKTGLHPVNLENTVNDFNNNIKNNQSDSFGRLHRPLAIEQGNAYVNGMGVTPALTYGRLLGQRI